jgi:hypothetical protein
MPYSRRNNAAIKILHRGIEEVFHHIMLSLLLATSDSLYISSVIIIKRVAPNYTETIKNAFIYERGLYIITRRFCIHGER